MAPEEWHRLLHTPITRDRYLETLRVRLRDLPLKTSQDGDGALYAPSTMPKISALLDELRTKRM